MDAAFPGRQVRLLFAYLTLHRPQQVPREAPVAALWDDSPPAAAATALNALISKVRALVGPDVLRGRSELAVMLPETALVDVETALAAVHAAGSAIALRNWRRAWPLALTARFVVRRRFPPDATTPWVDSWRDRLTDVHVRALECYSMACLHLGCAQLPRAARSARELLKLAPQRETGHLLLMRALAAQGNVAEAVAVYERLRVLLRE